MAGFEKLHTVIAERAGYKGRWAAGDTLFVGIARSLTGKLMVRVENARGEKVSGFNASWKTRRTVRLKALEMVGYIQTGMA